MIRAAFIICALLLVGAGAYLGHAGIWRESYDLDRSVRAGSPGAGGIIGRVK
ncbi:hypothetical protein [Pseudaestuariivita atlantica]|uniref:hypothetical protein n=1 Tax=Pseudaestuariivita atlantica TaxID=1317121 RepID=UPI0013F4A634|nr:hypothetical protein [Pseudaestuariivita atlantica]